MKATFRETFQAEPVSLAVVNEQLERRARAIMEWKGGALRHCCRTSPPFHSIHLLPVDVHTAIEDGVVVRAESLRRR